MSYVFTLAIVVVYASSALAEADLDPNIFKKQPASTAGSSSATREGTGATTSPTKSTGTPTKAGINTIPGSINPGSVEGKQSQDSGSGTNAAVGAALMAMGAMMMSQPPTVPPGAILMAMGILAMMQSGEDSDAAGQSANTGAASVTNGAGTDTVGVTASDGKGSAGITEAKIKEGQAKLAEAGYKLDKSGLTTPDGSVIPTSAFNSPSAMSAAGIPQSAIDAAQKILATAGNGGALDGAKVSSVGVNSGGGGGGSGVTEGESDGASGAGGGPLGNPFNINAEKKGQLVAGKTVMFDGEPIGVRGQNIFEMIHACYQKKREGKHFIESEADIATRMPASVKLPKK